MEEGATLVNAVVGAVVSVVGSMVVPIAPLLGGAVAGYLEGGTRSDGIRVGFISGLIAVVPGALLGLLVFGIFGSLLLGMGPGMDGIGLGLFSFTFVAVFVLAVTAVMVGLSTLGGWVGNYVKYDTDLDL
ncbi:hypothetical protein SAMN05216559_2899 [Halomicrobium zhouii]|uniref:DUF5518 domain-containing protein n=1 Tax=Halomicrobium zhouii TaxID=767519 RepID=A0A1I6LQH9_9EURY|nr:DUF5518 domain-containing protein [Halomicrobium zhouii]SFS05668.1 hypothetical protein SAMN05216559_2899 [Halomicrobium zhouii]